MLACGIGITPLLALLGDLPYRPGEATLVYRARSEAEVAFRGELRLVRRAPRRPGRLPARAAGRPAVVAAAVAGRPSATSRRCARSRRDVAAVARLRLRPGRLDRGGPRRRARRRGAGASACTPNSSPGNGERSRRCDGSRCGCCPRWPRVVLLFSYRTSTMGRPATGSRGRRHQPAAAGRQRRRGSGAVHGTRRRRLGRRGGTTYQRARSRRPGGGRSRSRSPSPAARSPSVAVPTYPNGNGRDQEINAYALPILQAGDASPRRAPTSTPSPARP